MLLYLHIPFCDSLCHYCAFNSYTHLHHLKKDYMSAILDDLRYEIKRFNVKYNSIESVFIGGGTPSCINTKDYELFFRLISPYLKDDIEITTEANPNSATDEWLKGMKDLGVNRVSFGVQTFNDEKLLFLNRSHSKEQAIKAIKNADKIGFRHISIDLIYGTIKDTKELLLTDLDIAFSLPIDHLSAYSLTIEENTKFYTTANVSVDDEYLANLFVQEIKKRGFNQYEISNFGKYKSKHNMGYWQYKDYIGVGSGSVGFLKDKRFYSQKDPNLYIKNPIKKDIEKLNSIDILEEKILLGFRSDIGVDKGILSKKQLQNANILVKEKKLVQKEERLYNTNFFLSDEIALFILS